MKNKYDTMVVFLYATGNEHLLPPEFRRKIPHSTASTWRKTDFSRYIGHEFRYLFEDALNHAETQKQLRELRLAMRGFARSWIVLASAIRPVIRNGRRDRKLQKDILNAIGYMRRYIGLERALKILGLTKNQYREWELENRFDCLGSWTALCVKRHPHQLTVKDVGKMKSMLTDPRLDHWPIVSVAAFAMRQKQVIASLYSWYKYARLLDITKKPPKKQRKTEGLIATRPNEYWHVDTTYYMIDDETRVCITFVMDNFSKMILGYHTDYRLSFELVKQALEHALKTVSKHPDAQKSTLVADGGSENHHREVNSFIAKLTNYEITKITALKDIRFSNSPVEAVHRTMKYRYLKNRPFNSLDALNDFLEWAVMDYNIVRPHYRHRPRTPFEVYFDKPLDFDVRQRMREAMACRVAENKCTGCTRCEGFSCRDL